MKKVLIIDNSLQTTGAIKSINLFAQLLKEKYEFHFCLDNKSTITKDVESLGCKVLRIDFHELSKDVKSVSYKRDLKKNSKEVYRYMMDNGIDILHVNDLYNQLGVRIKKKHPEVKLVYHIRLMRQSYIRLLYPYFIKRIAKYADKVICVSDAVMNDVSRYISDAERIYDPIMLPEKVSKYSKPKQDEIKLLSLGLLVKGKGQDLLLNGFKKAYKKDKSLRLTFIGGNPQSSKYGKKLMQYVDENGLGDVVQFRPRMNADNSLYKDYDISVNFSESESFSYVCLESLYFGIPLISSDCGGPSELFEHNKSGFLVDNRDIDQLSKAILKLAGDFELRKAFSENGKDYVRTKFSAKNSANKLEKIYRSLE